MSQSKNNTSDFIRLLTNHQTALRGLIISLLPGCQDINDILQDTNVVLWEKMHTYEPSTNFRSWAFTIARNKVMQYWDKQKKQNRLVLSEKIILAVAEAKKDSTPEHIEHKLSALNQCLETLNQGERDLIDKRYSSKISLESYSTEIGRPVASLRVSLYRIRKKLRACIDKRLQMKGGIA